MSTVGIDKVVRAPAIDGRKLPADLIDALLLPSVEFGLSPSSHLSLTPPAVGCFLSHLAVWRWAIRQGLPRVLVLEDDAMPSALHTPELFRRTIASMPHNVGLAFLGRIIMGGLAETPNDSGLARLYYFNGTFAYLVTPRACARLLNRLLPMRSHIDHQMSSVLIEQRRTFPAYYTEPALFEPDWSLRSDCYVPIVDDNAADRELGSLIEMTRSTLHDEGRRLLPLSA
jgi:GR25 family glycosyltransferase involved in LPS biosynthesis